MSDKQLTFTLVDHVTGEEHVLETTGLQVDFDYAGAELSPWSDPRRQPVWAHFHAPVLSFTTNAAAAQAIHDVLYPGPRPAPIGDVPSPSLPSRLAWLILAIAIVAAMLAIGV